MNGFESLYGKSIVGAAAILLTAFLAGCGAAESSPLPSPTAAIPSAETPTKTAAPTAAPTDTMALTLARLPSFTKTSEPTQNRKYYDLVENYSILPPPGWTFSWSYRPNTYWWELSDVILRHERVSPPGSKEALYAKYKAVLNSAPQHKVLFEEDFSTDEGILSHKFGDHYKGKTKMIQRICYFIPVGKDFLVFTYLRYEDSSPKLDDTVQASINSVEILIPE
jgi:hypothetical protein